MAGDRTSHRPSTRSRPSSKASCASSGCGFANTRYRVLYQRSDNLVVLLHVIEKDTGAVPVADVELAKRRMKDFKRRMDAARRRPPRPAGRDAPPPRRPRR